MNTTISSKTQKLFKQRNFKKNRRKNRRIPKNDNGISKQSQLGSMLYFQSSLIYIKYHGNKRQTTNQRRAIFS